MPLTNQFIMFGYGMRTLTHPLKIADGLTLNVTVRIPSNPVATMVIHHGYGGSIASPVVKRLSEVFFSAGYVTVLPNTANSLNDSGGDIQKFTFSQHASDLGAVIEWTKTQDWFLKDLSLAGYSLGGFSATKALQANEDIQSLFLIAPILSGNFFQEGIEASNPRIMEYWEEEMALEFTNDQDIKFQAPYACWNEWLSADAMEVARSYKGKVSILTAGQDPLIQPDHLDVIKRAFCNARLSSARIRNENHFFSVEPNSLEAWALKQIANHKPTNP